MTQQPAAPPALLSAAVMGDLSKFETEWKAATSAQDRVIKDRQQNNILHALFSCRSPQAKAQDVLNLIHTDLSESQLVELYEAKNNLGCTPIWILVAYGNVDLLKHVQTKVQNLSLKVSELLTESNHQGDSPLLATCSQGNTSMVKFLKDNAFSKNDADWSSALSQANSKGTTPLQIVIGNAHSELLGFLLQEESSIAPLLTRKNTAGLSLFHICSERNFASGLKLLLEYMTSKDNKRQGLEQVLDIKDKNQANALHVAAFCGNEEAVQVWINVTQSVCNDDVAAAIKLLDRMDGQARTAYWLTMVQGHEKIGAMLAATGVDTKHPNMVKEIEEAKERRAQAAKKKEQQRLIDGASLSKR